MEGDYSQFYSFIERLKTDDDLRQRLMEAEQSAVQQASELKEQLDAVSDANLAAIRRIAEEAGYDISVDVRRPEKTQVAPTDREMENLFCVFTCCLMVTSVWDTEGAGGSGPF